MQWYKTVEQGTGPAERMSSPWTDITPENIRIGPNEISELIERCETVAGEVGP